MTDAEYFEMNRAGWDQRVKAHVESRPTISMRVSGWSG